MLTASIWVLIAIGLSTSTQAGLLENLLENTVSTLSNTTSEITNKVKAAANSTETLLKDIASSLDGDTKNVADYTNDVLDTTGSVVQYATGELDEKVKAVLEGDVKEAVDAGEVTQETINTLYAAVADVNDDSETLVVSSVSDQCAALKTTMQLLGDQVELSGNEPDVSKLTLNYITRDSYQSYKLSAAAEEILKSTWFKPNQPFMVFAHGFTDKPNGTNYRNVSDSVLRKVSANIVALDSSALIGSQYLRSTKYVKYIGEELANFLYAINQAGVNASSIYLVGHSLGAHICGFAGKKFYSLSGQKVSRITGLDPAGPCFTKLDSTLRLNRNDAEFVDVIQTNAGVAGLDQDIGHVNYAPNGGSSQPGCATPDCSHGRVIYLFCESVQDPESFPAVACDSWLNFREGKCNYTDISYMGYGSSNQTRGKYFLQTEASSPYARGEDGITYSGIADQE